MITWCWPGIIWRREEKDYANKLLVKAFGEEGARELLHQVTMTEQLNSTRLASLQKAGSLAAGQIRRRRTHPQTIALILAHLEAKQASILLMRLPEEQARRSRQAAGPIATVFPGDGGSASPSYWNKTKLEALGEQSRRAYMPDCAAWPI